MWQYPESGLLWSWVEPSTKIELYLTTREREIWQQVSSENKRGGNLMCSKS